MQLRKFHVTLQGGEQGEVAGVAYGDPVTPVEVMFLHAAGLNGVTYQSIIQPLANKAHVAAVDFRGHGMTLLPHEMGRLRSLDTFRDDVIATIEKSAPGGLILGGHAMGALVALLVAARAPHLVHGLVMVDPDWRTPEFYKYAHLPFIGRLTAFSKAAKQARNRRRTRFPSHEEAEALLADKPPYKAWRTPFLHDYLVDGLTWVADQNYELSCEPRWESACLAAQANRPWTALSQLGAYRERWFSLLQKLSKLDKEQRQPRLQEHLDKLAQGKLRRSQIAKHIPVIILQAEKDSAAVEDLDNRVHSVLPDAAVTRIPGTSHYLPMERPYVVREALDVLYRSWRGEFEDDYIGAVRRTINDSIGIMG